MVQLFAPSSSHVLPEKFYFRLFCLPYWYNKLHCFCLEIHCALLQWPHWHALSVSWHEKILIIQSIGKHFISLLAALSVSGHCLIQSLAYIYIAPIWKLKLVYSKALPFADSNKLNSVKNLYVVVALIKYIQESRRNLTLCDIRYRIGGLVLMNAQVNWKGWIFFYPLFHHYWCH